MTPKLHSQGVMEPEHKQGRHDPPSLLSPRSSWVLSACPYSPTSFRKLNLFNKKITKHHPVTPSYESVRCKDWRLSKHLVEIPKCLEQNAPEETQE